MGLTRGEYVKIISGPEAGKSGRVVYPSYDGRVLVSINDHKVCNIWVDADCCEFVSCNILGYVL